MNHLVVDRRANRRGIAVIALERRRRARLRESAPPQSHRDPPSSPRGPPSRVSAVSTCPPACPAARILSSSAADRQMITARPAHHHALRRDPRPRRQRRRHQVRACAPSTARNVGRAPVVVHERLPCCGGRPSTAPAPPTRCRRSAASAEPPHFCTGQTPCPPDVGLRRSTRIFAQTTASRAPHQLGLRHHDVDRR